MENFLEKSGCAIIAIPVIAGLVTLFGFPEYFLVFLIGVGVLVFVFSILLGYMMAKSGEQDGTLRISFKDVGITLAIGVAGIGCGWVAFKLSSLGIGSDVQQFEKFRVTTTPGPSFIIVLPFILGGIVGTVVFIKRIFGLITKTSCYLFSKALSAPRSKDQDR